MGAGSEVVNLCLDQLPIGLKLILPHTDNTDHISDPRKHEKIYTQEEAGTCAVDTHRSPLIQLSFVTVHPGDSIRQVESSRLLLTSHLFTLDVSCKPPCL